MDLRKIYLCVLCLLGAIMAACGEVEPTVQQVNPESVWEQFIKNLPELSTYLYTTEMTSYRNLISNEAYQPPQQASLHGSGEQGRILREYLGDQGRPLARQLIISGVVYEAQIEADLQEKWVLAYVPDTPTDIGQPFILRELIDLGAKSEFKQVDENGAYLFILTVPQQVMADWLERQYTTSLDEFLRAGKELPDENKNAFKRLYDLLSVEQVIEITLNVQGSILETSTEVKRINDPEPVAQVLYKTTYSDLNLNTISIPAP